MNSNPSSPTRHTRSRYNNVIRESDVHADPEYKQKKEFFDQLKLKVQMNCNVLKENAVKEAKSIRDNLTLLISQLPARVQTMTVAEFCKTFGFELIDGNLVMMEDANAQNQTAQRNIFQTVQTHRVVNQPVTPLKSGPDVLSQLQIVRNGTTAEPGLQLIKNNVTYDLSSFKQFSPMEKQLIQAEVVTFTKMLNSLMEKV